jgi:murein L,D-transpeptidase YcbB/YkuD
MGETVMIRALAGCLAAVLLAAPVAARASDEAVAGSIVAILAREDPLVLDGVTLKSHTVRALYEGRSGSPLWQDRVDAVTKVLGDAAAEGLDPAAYHLTVIATRQADRSDEGRATLDLLVSNAVLRYASDVRYGRERPRMTAEVALDPAPDPVPLVQVIATAADSGEAMRALSPPHPEYRRLRAVLADYRAMLAAGVQWPVIPDGPTIRPGNSDPAVPTLRTRLAASGEFTGDSHVKSQRFDPPLVNAVKVFQERHGLKADGAVGAKVRAALNVGPATRIEQLVANMERWRWMPDDLGSKRVMVNIAAARVRLVEGDSTVFEGPVIVGELDKMTPMFSSTITQVIYNPAWTVPDKIARKELLPKVQRDSAYFERQGIRLIGSWHPSAHGEDPEKVDWQGAHGASGFRLRQAPGPQNPLGRVKFLIPNVFGVYLHDTSNRNLFARDTRTLSHGCVRVGSALELADDLLEAQHAWSTERRDHILSDWKTTIITLDQPVPVHLMYETAMVASDVHVHFMDDVYGRDRRLSDALAGRRPEPVSAVVRVAEP